MAATRLIALHVNKGKTVAQCLADRTDYSQNAAKTNDGEFISSYECDPKTADEEFLLSKRQYQHITGRQQKNNIIAYQIRQSFKPGEITPEEANQVGYETAMRWTRENTLSSLRPTSTNPTFTIISFIIRPRWMPHGNSKTSFFPVWRCKDSVIWFAWNTGCPLLHRSRIGSARKELFIPSYCVLHERCTPSEIPDNSQPIKPIIAIVMNGLEVSGQAPVGISQSSNMQGQLMRRLR